MENYLSKKEAARYLGTSPTTIQRLVSSGRLPPRYVGFQPKFRKEDLDAAIRKSPYHTTEVENNDAP